MKTLKKIILFVFISAVFITCKKEELAPNTVEGQPVFSFTGNIGSSSLNLQAGINNYYMYSSYTDSNGVYNFTGTLQNTSSNKNSIQIVINDDVVSASNAPSDISNSVSPKVYYVYNIPGGNPIGDSVYFYPLIYSGTPSTYAYVFGDGTSSSISNPVHYYKFLSNNTTYSSALTIQFNSGQVVTAKNPVRIIKGASNPLTIDSINYQLANDSTHNVLLTAYVTGGNSPYSYVWNMGNSTTKAGVTVSSSTSINIPISYTYTATPARTYTVTLGILDTLKDTVIYNYTLFDSITNNPRMDYYISPPVAASNPKALSNVTVNYTDGLGNAYTSNNSSQPNTSTFQVISVSNYKNNLNNQTTKELEVKFNCILYPVLGGAPIAANNCTAIIAVAYH